MRRPSCARAGTSAGSRAPSPRRSSPTCSSTDAGSGPRTRHPDRGRRVARAATLGALAVGLAAGPAGCAYFNALYNAHRLYERGRKEIERGNESSGRTALAEAIRKAERALERYPDSRYADDALGLIARARLLRGEHTGAADAASELARRATSDRERRRAAAYLGRAKAGLGEAEAADSLLTFALSGPLPGEERVAAIAARGHARRLLGRWDEARADYTEAQRRRPDDPRLRLAQFYMLLDAARWDEAAQEFRRLLARPQVAAVEDDILAAADSFAARAPDTARAALATAESGPFRASARAKLLVLRGRLREAAGARDSARADYARATELAPGTDGAALAYAALARLALREAATLDDLAEIRASLARAAPTGAGRGFLEARALANAVDRLRQLAEAGDVAVLRAAEIARDELGAPLLARALFLRFADEFPNAVWAPKAILAALALGPYDARRPPPGPTDDELRDRLRETYGANPYVRATLGDGSDAGEVEALYAVSEQALNQRLRAILSRLEGRPPGRVEH